MASSYYSSAVANPRLGQDGVPDDAEARPHHVKKGGKTTHFKNIHPSAGNMFAAWPMWRALIAYVDLGAPLLLPSIAPFHWANCTLCLC
jgi:hypothetical protein